MKKMLAYLILSPLAVSVFVMVVMDYFFHLAGKPFHWAANEVEKK